jgi:transcriptional regulator with XRE-family HTH domain
MTARNALFSAVPHPVERAINKVGKNLKLARLRRKQTIREVAEKIGTGVRAVRDAENGKASTAVAVYAALLWAHDLLQPFEDLADPRADEEGFALAGIGKTGHARARRSRGLSNDF